MTASGTRRRVQRHWALYDVANSAFVTTMVAALGGPYLLGLADAVKNDAGQVTVAGVGMAPGAFVAYMTTVSVVLQVLLLPLLGAVVDATGNKRRALAVTALAGAGLTGVLAALPPAAWLAAGVVYAAANVCFGASIVPYNAMLTDIASPAERDRVSARGFAAGYAGGGVLLALNLALLLGHDALGLSKTAAARVDIASVSVWWAAFTLIALRGLPHADRGAARSVGTAVRHSLGELKVAVADLRRFPQAARYLVSFLLWNDAIQGVIGLAGVFIVHELFVANGQSESDGTPFVMLLVLVIQAAAVPGALGFARLADRMGTSRTILASLVVWIGIVVFAWTALATKAQAVALAVAIALVLGGSQSLARSLFTKMIPPGRENAWMGLYETSERGTSWISPLMFGLALDATGSYRLGLASLLVLFVAGAAVLATVDVRAAIRAAGGADDDSRPDLAPALA